MKGTPTKTKAVPDERNYAANLYTLKEMSYVMYLVNDIADQAEKNRGRCTEPEWVSEVVGPLLSQFTRLSLCRATGKRTISHYNIKIDHALAIDITNEETRTLSGNGPKYRVQGSASINQTQGNHAFHPMFANFGVKVDGRDPLVHLAVWFAAELEKRAIEGYPTNIPMPSIEIYKDAWHVYLAYAMFVPEDQRPDNGKNYRVQFAGPVAMGDTASIEGIFRIFHVLKAIVRWGTDVYGPEYFEKILAIYK
ncbi:MAG: hypothetical protein Q9169_006887 [Polycauliona sp. 2 TL-2023]